MFALIVKIATTRLDVRTERHPFLAPVVLLIVIFGLFEAPAAAQLGEDEIWFDGPTKVQPGSDRTVPDIAVDGLRRTVVAWEVNTEGQDVYVRLFDVDGTALTDPQRANTTTENSQGTPKVAAAPDGSFVVIWVNRFNAARGGNVFSIRSQYFDSSGTAVGSEQIVSQQDPSISGGAQRPDLTALTGGGFAAVWRSSTFSGGGDPGVSIQGRLLSATGVPTGNQFQVNTTTTGIQEYPAIGALPAVDPDGPFDGGFVVAWTRPDVHLRRFQSNGTSAENDQQVDTDAGARLHLAVAEDSGQVAITWQDNSAVWVRLFDANLGAVTAVEQVSLVSDTDADRPTITDIGLDGFYLAWSTATGVGTDMSGTSIQARILAPTGVFDGGQFQVNTWETFHQRDPRLASSSGRLGIVWRSNGNPQIGGNDDHMIGYLLEYCLLFCDDFESGNTDAWSSSSP